MRVKKSKNKSTRGKRGCARKHAFLVFIVCVASLVNSVQGFACNSNAVCQYPGCNDNSCSCSSSSSNPNCIDGFWTGFSQCKNGVWDTICSSGNCWWLGQGPSYGHTQCPDPPSNIGTSTTTATITSTTPPTTTTTSTPPPNTVTTSTPSPTTPLPWWICPCKESLWREYHDPQHKGIFVKVVVALSYSEQEFTQDLRNTFIASVAVAADVQHFRVKINSVEETQAHSFVIVKVDFSVKVPTDEPAKESPILAAMTLNTLNTYLNAAGVDPIIEITTAAVVIRQ